jgi:hypothetical protein
MYKVFINTAAGVRVAQVNTKEETYEKDRNNTRIFGEFADLNKI